MPALAQSVLNASRHQRNNRVFDGDMRLGFAPCSTPHGIKGTIASNGLCSMGESSSVLNASRHQRNNRGRPWNGLLDEFMCSTPHGIKGTIAFARHPDLAHSTSAQRLTASKEQSR